jgi:hypothetical protein
LNLKVEIKTSQEFSFKVILFSLSIEPFLDRPNAKHLLTALVHRGILIIEYSAILNFLCSSHVFNNCSEPILGHKHQLDKNGSVHSTSASLYTLQDVLYLIIGQLIPKKII